MNGRRSRSRSRCGEGKRGTGRHARIATAPIPKPVYCVRAMRSHHVLLPSYSTSRSCAEAAIFHTQVAPVSIGGTGERCSGPVGSIRPAACQVAVSAGWSLVAAVVNRYSRRNHAARGTRTPSPARRFPARNSARTTVAGPPPPPSRPPSRPSPHHVPPI